MESAGSQLVLALTLVVCAAVMALAVYGYRAVRDLRHSSTVLAERAAQDGADLLLTALTRDMHGAQALVLANRDAGDYAAQALPDFSNEVSAAATRHTAASSGRPAVISAPVTARAMPMSAVSRKPLRR